MKWDQPWPVPAPQHENRTTQPRHRLHPGRSSYFRSQGVTALEILVVTVIVTLLSALLIFVLARATKESGTKTVCVENMRQITKAYQLYMADNDDAVPVNGWHLPHMLSYLKVQRQSELFCPKATSLSGVKITSYWDQPSHYFLSLKREPNVSRELGNGLRAPLFDIQKDSVLKCVKHGDSQYVVAESVIPYGGQRNTAAKIQTAYLDGHITFAHPIACWELPWKIDSPLYKQYPSLIRACDGTLETVN